MAQQLPEGTVAGLFTDVEGSTNLTTRRGHEAAQEMPRAQRALDQHNPGQPPDQQVRLRIGLTTGELIQEQAHLFGEGRKVELKGLAGRHAVFDVVW